MSGGFFSAEETQVKNKMPRRESCGACKLHKKCETPKPSLYGKGGKGILIVGEAPGRDDDEQGKPFVGKGGKYLRATLRRYGISLLEDCWVLNAVACAPYDEAGRERKPTDIEAGYCQPRLLRYIKKLKPKAVFLLGGVAVQGFLLQRYVGDRSGIRGINRWRGYTIPDQEYKTWVCPMYHPDHVLRSIDGKRSEIVVETLFEQDLEQALKYALEVDFPRFPKPKDCIEIITEPDEVQHALQKINLDAEIVTLDWETDRLRAYSRGAKIVSFSLAWENDKVISAPFPTRKSDQVLLKRILKSQNIQKTAHNMGFEQAWAWAKMGVTISPWLICTMNGAHVLDNRPRITSLKFQTYINFGVADYDSHMKEWLQAPPEEEKAKGANAQNKILELVSTKKGLETLLLYGAYDGLYEHWLARKMIDGGLVEWNPN